MTRRGGSGNGLYYVEWRIKILLERIYFSEIERDVAGNDSLKLLRGYRGCVRARGLRRAGLGGRRAGLRLRSRAVDRRPPSREHATPRRALTPRTRRYAPRLQARNPTPHPSHPPTPYLIPLTLVDTNCAKHKS
ncbi:jg10078 [Pararge aegeria aegeria]|uniref:Jg10078 protein n=1 Tax=Pararge aegeria aegeria TaxID=348720 RepID=A0A8S4SM69_9NEOP|nr:jg10078 [Pararge aegeria aegeria]